MSEELTEHYFFSENSFRCSIHAVVTFPLFDVFIMLVIVASSISLAAEVRPRRRLDTRAVCSITCLYFQDPINVDGEWNKFLGKLDYGFTCIFAIEVLLKVLFTIYVYIYIYLFTLFNVQILDYGLVLHPGSYLREMWNCMDLIVVSCAITSFTMDMM